MSPGIYLATKGEVSVELQLYRAPSGRMWARTVDSLKGKWAPTTAEEPGISLAKLTRRGWKLVQQGVIEEPPK